MTQRTLLSYFSPLHPAKGGGSLETVSAPSGGYNSLLDIFSDTLINILGRCNVQEIDRLSITCKRAAKEVWSHTKYIQFDCMDKLPERLFDLIFQHAGTYLTRLDITAPHVDLPRIMHHFGAQLSTLNLSVRPFIENPSLGYSGGPGRCPSDSVVPPFKYLLEVLENIQGPSSIRTLSFDCELDSKAIIGNFRLLLIKLPHLRKLKFDTLVPLVDFCPMFEGCCFELEKLEINASPLFETVATIDDEAEAMTWIRSLLHTKAALSLTCGYESGLVPNLFTPTRNNATKVVRFLEELGVKHVLSVRNVFHIIQNDPSGEAGAEIFFRFWASQSSPILPKFAELAAKERLKFWSIMLVWPFPEVFLPAIPISVHRIAVREFGLANEDPEQLFRSICQRSKFDPGYFELYDIKLEAMFQSFPQMVRGLGDVECLLWLARRFPAEVRAALHSRVYQVRGHFPPGIVHLLWRCDWIESIVDFYKDESILAFPNNDDLVCAIQEIPVRDTLRKRILQATDLRDISSETRVKIFWMLAYLAFFTADSNSNRSNTGFKVMHWWLDLIISDDSVMLNFLHQHLDPYAMMQYADYHWDNGTKKRLIQEFYSILEQIHPFVIQHASANRKAAIDYLKKITRSHISATFYLSSRFHFKMQEYDLVVSLSAALCESPALCLPAQDFCPVDCVLEVLLGEFRGILKDGDHKIAALIRMIGTASIIHTKEKPCRGAHALKLLETLRCKTNCIASQFFCAWMDHLSVDQLNHSSQECRMNVMDVLMLNQNAMVRVDDHLVRRFVRRGCRMSLYGQSEYDRDCTAFNAERIEIYRKAVRKASKDGEST